MKKIISILLIVFLLTSIIFINYSYASDMNKVISSMKGVGTPNGDDKSTGTVKIINSVIGIIQIAGSGISLIVITMLGIKYMLASPSEKADVKKNIMPILIGCVLLFAAVNLISMVETFSNAIFPEK